MLPSECISYRLPSTFTGKGLRMMCIGPKTCANLVQYETWINTADLWVHWYPTFAHHSLLHLETSKAF